MPQDPNLYGQPAPKRQKKSMPLTSSLSFTSQVASLLAAPTSSTATAAGRPRPSKAKADLFHGAQAKKRQRAAAAADDDAPAEKKDSGKLRLRSPLGTEDDKAEQARARRKMEQKARLYAAMARGDYVGKEGEAAALVDFDRKWAEKQAGGDGDGASSSGSDNESEDDDDGGAGELVEYVDEFGRARKVTRAAARRLQAARARGVSSAAELERMAGRPVAMPEGLIIGDAVQTDAYEEGSSMAALAARRDRSATPPEAVHFDASAEVRTKGVGFYAFSKGDEERREAEMAALAQSREETELVRKEREERVKARREEVERRRREIGEKRAKRMADSFLDGLGSDFLGGDGEADGATQEITSGEVHGEKQAEE